ncbi:MAG: acyltransferase family protein [Candidatus Xenobia bacterium]
MNNLPGANTTRGYEAVSHRTAEIRTSTVPASKHVQHTRYQFLDVLRGLAALLVVVHHVTTLPIGGPAVIVFFVISGYCITASAVALMLKNLGFRTFLTRRLRRIYPPYLLSVGFYLATRALKFNLTGTATDFHAIQVIQNLTLTQWASMLVHPGRTGVDNPVLFVAAYWSLGYEEQFYFVMAVLTFLCATQTGRLARLVGGTLAIGLVWNAVFPTTCYGLFIEYWVHFAVGSVVFWRLCRWESAAARRTTDAALATVALACAIWLYVAGYPSIGACLRSPTRILPFEILTSSSCGLLLIGLRRFSDTICSSMVGSVLTRLGTITFSLYLIHQFNLHLMHSLADRLISREHPVLNCVVQLVGHISLASAFWYFCERPFLNQRLDDIPPARRDAQH